MRKRPFGPAPAAFPEDLGEGLLTGQVRNRRFVEKHRDSRESGRLIVQKPQKNYSKIVDKNQIKPLK
jgi:hypothetical protein